MLRQLFNNAFVEASLNILPQCTSKPFRNPQLEHLGWLPSAAPCFPVRADCIQIISEPRLFYQTLIQRSLEAKRRITLASLYLGTGDLERKLVETIAQNQHFLNGDLKVNILLDYTRGSRYECNSRTMLLPLLQRNKFNCEICLYHTPFLRGLKKKMTPHRFNEIFGIQHMKLYIFDDCLIISGANLSNDYFTNRQDRYFEIRNKHLVDFYHELVSKVQQFSLKLDINNNINLNKNWNLSPYESSKYEFIHESGNLITNFILDSKIKMQYSNNNDNDTWIFPLIQMGQLGIEQDSFVTEHLLSQAPKNTKLFMGTGYFNLTERYVNTIVKNTEAECNILMAHPDANGFQGAKFPAGGIPSAYSLIAYNFYHELMKQEQINRVTLYEYLRKGWTYHAKGLWYYPVGDDKPCLTLIGSPNFGERSVKKDLETQLAIVTENEDLRERLHNECRSLYELGLPANVHRHVPKWVYAMVFFFKGFF